MGITTDLSAGPYYDDFVENAETKNYHRVLFKPATAVQARELTQLQSILQDQIEKFGDNILVNGTIIKGGNFVELAPLPYVKILDNDTDNRPINLSGTLRDSITGEILNNIIVRGATSGVEAKLVTYLEGFQTQTDKNTLYVKYIKAAEPDGTYDNVDTFRPTENLLIIAVDSDGADVETLATYTVAGTRDNNETGNGYGVSCGNGIVYQKGHFINFVDQTVIVERYSTAPTNKAIGFLIDEDLVNANQDDTLFDNAQGYNNYNAPGADRLKLTPTLTVKTIQEARADENFFILQEYNNGRLVRTNTRTQYNVLGKEMARRTKEESGNYSLKPFDIRVDEFSDVSTFSDDFIKLTISPGIAYVEGERFELINEYATAIEKSKDSLTQPQQNISINYGNYVEVEDLIGDFDTDTFGKVELHGVAYDSTAYTSVSNNTYPTNLVAGDPITQGGNVIGTARVRSIQKVSDNKFRLYLFDICMTCSGGGQFYQTKAVSFVDSTHGSGANVILNSEGRATLVDDTFKSAIFGLGRSYIKSVTATGNSDYTYIKKVNNVSATTTATVSLSESDEESYIIGAFNRDQRNSLIIIDSNGNTVPTDEILSVTGSSSSIVITFTGDKSSVSPLIVYASVKKTNVKPIFKELVNAYVRVDANTHTDLASGQYSLGLPDVYAIDKIWMYPAADSGSANSTFTEADATSSASIIDVTNQFTLFTNQKDSYYDYSYIQKKRALAFDNADTLLVKVKVFKKNISSGAGFDQSFFSVDSYPYVGNPSLPSGYSGNTISIAEIPSHTSESGRIFNLRDSVDFRPYAANTVAYATTEAAAGKVDLSVTAATSVATFGTTSVEFPSSGLPLEVDFDYYLGRVDKVYISEKGQIQVEKGNPSENPSIPADPATGMVLGTIYIPPYPSLPGQQASRLGHPEYAITYTRPGSRRYTMADIGKLDARLKNIEYYTTLNTLEKAANDATVKDNAGIDRFKNGIFVDSFEDLKSANTNSPEFAASIDPSLKEIAPRTRQFYLDLVVSSSNNVIDHGEAITLDYLNTAIITQPYATQTKSCTTNFYRYNGTMTIYPEYDGGAETSVAPDIHFPDIDIAGAFADFAEILNESVPFQRTVADVAVSTNTQQVSSGSSRGGLFGLSTVRTTNLQTTTTTATLNAATEITVDETSITSKVGEFITDVRFLPFMRSRDIEIEIFGMMPNKRVYFFFDGEDVNAHIAKAQRKSTISGPSKLTRTSRFSAENVIRADENGVVRAIFRIPENRFYVGDRDLEVSSAKAYVDISNEVTYAKRTYRAFNFNSEKTSAFVTTRIPTFSSDTSLSVTARTNTDQWQITQRTNEALLQAQINGIRRNLGDLTARVSANEEAIADNTAAIDSLAIRVSNNEAAIAELEQDIIDLGDANGELQAQIDVLTNENTILDGRITTLENENTTLDASIVSLQAQVDQIEADNATTVTTPTFGGGAGATTTNVATGGQTGDRDVGGLADGGQGGDGGGGGGGGGSDPIAQTFYLEPDVSTDEVVQITQVEVFFSAVSSRGNGVTVQIVETVNGYPGQTGVPFGAVHLDKDEVNVSDDGTVPTTFVFPAPVTLRTDRDYALVVQPDGNDPDYRVFICKTGGVDLSTGLAITQDTNAGVLFTSTNKKAWTPYQDENLKFTLYKATYTTSTGTVTLTNNNDEFFDMLLVNGTFRREEFVFKYKPFYNTGSISIVEGNTTIVAAGQGDLAGVETGDKIVYENPVTGKFGVLTVVTVTPDAAGDIMTVEEFPEATITEARWIKTCVGKVNFYSVSPFDGATRLFLTQSTADTDDRFVDGDEIYGADSSAIGTIGTVLDQPISKIIPNVYKTNTSLTRTSLTATKLYRATGGTYSKAIAMNAEQYLFDEDTVIRSRSNEVADSQTNTFELQIKLDNLSGFTRDTSPFLDHEVCNLLAMEYLINDISDEYVVSETQFPYELQSEKGTNGNADAKYITKTIELSNGQSAADLQLFLTAYRPPNTDIHVYAKFLSETDNRVFNTVEWSIMKLDDGYDEYSSLTNRADYKEFKFIVPTAQEVFGVNATIPGGGAVKLINETTQLIDDDITYEAPNGSSFNAYKYFAIKIVFSGSSHSAVPRVKNIRSIALAGA